MIISMKCLPENDLVIWLWGIQQCGVFLKLKHFFLYKLAAHWLSAICISVAEMYEHFLSKPLFKSRLPEAICSDQSF